MEKKKLMFSSMLIFRQRLAIYSISLISTVFLTFYTQLVCPFLEGRPFFEEFRNLIILFAFQFFLRELLMRFTSTGWGVGSISKKYYRMMVASWLITGLVAMLFHEYIYNDIFTGTVGFLKPWPSDYPWHSHLKVLSGYWFLGAGLLSQLELSFGERYIRSYILAHREKDFSYFEKISSRITLGNFFYTFVPSVSVLIMVLRYAIQDKIIPLSITLEIAYIGIVFILTALFAAYIYGKMLREDTESIVDAVRKIGTGDFDIQLIPTRQDELGQVAGGINEMAQGLVLRERIRESFGYFVSPEIAKQFIDEYSQGKEMRGHGDRKNVAVLMCDIRNFSGLSEDMDPSDVTKMLNNYFDHMVGAIEKNGGLVDKFIGDAVMAVFGVVEGEDNSSLQAVNAAVDMRKALVDANVLNKSQGLPELNNGIGIHYGEVIASYLGSSSRLEFTVIGSTVNVAARLESQAKAPNPPIIISSIVAKAVADDHKIVGCGEVELKGVGTRKLFSVKL